MRRPSIKFYPVDWLGNHRLRACSLAARGLWIDLLAHMHDGDPHGHLLVNGLPPTPEEVAHLVGRPIDEVVPALAELRKFCDTDPETGAIISPRMIRARARSAIYARNAKARGGGNPVPSNLQDQLEDQEEARHRLPEPPDYAGFADLLFEASAGKVERDVPIQPILDLIDDGADLEDDVLPVIREMVATLETPMRNWRAAWLHREILDRKRSRETVKLDADIAESPDYRPGQSSRFDWDELVAGWTSGNLNWDLSLGPQPGEAGCRVPPDVLASYGITG